MPTAGRVLPAVAAVVATCLSLIATSANADSRWEPVPPDQLALARATVEPDADAEALFWKVWVEDEVLTSGSKTLLDHYVRLKIFTEAGARDRSTVTIDFPKKDVRVTDVAARTIQPDGTVIELDRKAVFKETMVRKGHDELKRLSFAVPGLKPGSIFEYRYREMRLDAITHYAEFAFQRDVPVQKVTYFLKPLSAPGWHMRQMTFHVAAISSHTPVNGYFETTARDQRVFRAEPDMPPEAQLRAWMLLYYTQQADVGPAAYWKRVGAEAANEFDDWTRPNADIKRQAIALMAGAADDSTRLGRLFRFCRHDLRISGSLDPDSLRAFGIRRNASAGDVLKQRAGSAMDANYLFASLARAAGFPVRLVRLVPRTRLYFEPSMTTSALFNAHDIAVRTSSGWRFFDISAKHLPADMLRWEEEGARALLCDPDSTRFVELPLSPPERSTVGRAAHFQLAEDGTLEGDVRLTLAGHWNALARSRFADLTGTELESALKTESQWSAANVEISKVALLPGADPAQPLQITCHMKLREHATIAGRRVLLEPSAFHAHEPPRYSASKRRYPVCYPFAWSEADTIRIRLPAAYKVEAVDSPKPVHAAGVASYDATVAVSDDGLSILYVRSMQVGENGSIYFPAASYGGVKKLFDLMHESDQFALTLTRADTGP